MELFWLMTRSGRTHDDSAAELAGTTVSPDPVGNNCSNNLR